MMRQAAEHRTCNALRVCVLAAMLLVPVIDDGVAQTDAAAATGQMSPRAKQTADRRNRIGNLVGHGGPIKAIQIDVNTGRVLTGAFDYAAMVWDISSGEPRVIHRLDQHGGPVNAVAFVPGGDRALTAADDGVVTLWNLSSGKPLHRFAGHQGKVVGLDVSADGRWAVSSGWDRTARLWDLVARQAGPVLDDHAGPVNAAVFSADATTIFTASYDGNLRAFERASGHVQRRLLSAGQSINALVRLAGSDRLLYGTVSGQSALVESSGEQIFALPELQRPVLALAHLEKPGLIATGSGDGVIRIFRSTDGALLEDYKNPFGPVWALAFTASGTGLYYGGLDDFATHWQVAPRAPFEPVDSTYPRRFQMSGSANDPIAKGEIQFARKCSVCHTLTPDNANRAGPTLHGIFGRRIATLAGYPFSAPLKTLDIVWTADTISKLFELGPDVVTPGSKMPLQKMTDASDRDALIAFLQVATKPEAVDAIAPNASESKQQHKGDGKP
jgi:cytochrome c